MIFLFQFDGDLYLAPGFKAPPNLDYIGYHDYIDEMLPAENPVLYGLHPNAEIEFLTVTSNNLFKTILEMQPKDNTIGEGSGSSLEEKVGQVCCHRCVKLIKNQSCAVEVFFLAAYVNENTTYLFVDCLLDANCLLQLLVSYSPC